MTLECNFDELLDRVGGDRELLAEMAIAVLSELDQLIGAVDVAVRERDAAALKSAAHRLKGTTGNFEVPQLFQVCWQLEQAAGTEDWEQPLPLYGQLETHVIEFKTLLEALASPESSTTRY